MTPFLCPTCKGSGEDPIARFHAPCKTCLGDLVVHGTRIALDGDMPSDLVIMRAHGRIVGVYNTRTSKLDSIPRDNGEVLMGPNMRHFVNAAMKADA